MRKTYSKALLRRMKRELSELFDTRDHLESQLDEVKKRIHNVDKIITHLMPLAGEAITADIPTLGLTDAIRKVMELSESQLSASDVYDELKDRRFDFSKYSQPTASIHTVLRRLASKGEITAEKDDWNVYYRKKEKSESSVNKLEDLD